ncbi:hypothetical protein SYNPS1DRAFT_27648 [Syncephalis pseudoplumigaleata]|uniref:G-protein coupled receptors family 2 profile 2 domain-containing protein n=1 Tax=Syncephalis pseudoplumigaleata TaxID=1712513 RepID=A0A4P9Z2G0_9FUNG|nr:hypothetical protein SYNPS1DRAFT_27648 [Syncephalis pseudoplumigaleata]|eukprot:RKP26674.1 hypothetical protein SYNPS1DRAFT_27648 [Syncephalis pseudoplumigaleata]
MHTTTIPSSFNGFEFFWDARDEPDTLRERYKALRFQLLCAILLSMVFMRNIWRSALVSSSFSRKLAPWCCLFISTLGLILLCGVCIPSIGLNGLSCHTMGWCLIVGVMLSSIGTNLILFERAYVAYQQSRWFFVVGLLLAVVPAIVFLAITSVESSVEYNAIHGCFLRYPDYLPYVRIFVDLPPNITFSVIFCMVIYRNYRRHREHMWKELAQDGIIMMLLVAVSNIVCFIVGESNIMQEYTNMVYIADWVLTSTLLTESIYKIHFRTSTYSRNKKSASRPHNSASDMPCVGASTTGKVFEMTGMTTFYVGR